MSNNDLSWGVEGEGIIIIYIFLKELIFQFRHALPFSVLFYR